MSIGKKKAYLLFEMLIALGLASLLLTFLFSCLKQHLRVGMRIEAARTEILHRQNLQTRLQDLLTSLSYSPSQSTLYTRPFPPQGKESLVLLFDHGIDPDPLFSGKLLGRIYVDEKQNLCLAMWPIEHSKNRPWRKEILLPHVSNASFQFLGDKKEANPKIEPVTPQLGWHESWPKERGDLPFFIRLSLSQGDTSLDFAFRLPTATPVVTYWKRG